MCGGASGIAAVRRWWESRDRGCGRAILRQAQQPPEEATVHALTSTSTAAAGVVADSPAACFGRVPK